MKRLSIFSRVVVDGLFVIVLVLILLPPPIDELQWRQIVSVFLINILRGLTHAGEYRRDDDDDADDQERAL
jgi:hypothetical protein